MLTVSIDLISVATFITFITTFSSGVFMIEALRYDGEGKYRYIVLFLLSFTALGLLLTYGFQNV